VSIVVAESQKLFMTLLQRLEPGQALIDGDLSHLSASPSMSVASDDDDGIVVEGLSTLAAARAEVDRARDHRWPVTSE
jgi:hypothetical protein